MKKHALKRLRELEKEKARLKRAMVDLTLDIALLKEILKLSAKKKHAGYRTVWCHLSRNV